MVLRLDPRVPLLWRDPTTLQAGDERPLAVIEHADLGVERLLAALAVGIDERAVDVVAEFAGLDPVRAAAIVDALAPALLAAAPTGVDEGGIALPRVVVDGDGLLAASIARVLAETADVARIASGDAVMPPALPRRCDLAVLVVDRVARPETMGAWLRRDVPHLLVVAHESSVTVGPLVEPGVGPCLYCRHRALVDEDAAWPAIAAQLAALPAPSPPAVLVAEAAALAARVVAERLARGSDAGDSAAVDHATTGASPATGSVPPADAVSVRVEAATGARTRRVWHRHPQCACRDETAGRRGLSRAARRGSDSASAASAALPRRRTTRATSDAEPA